MHLSSQNVNLFQVYQRFGQLFGGNWCKNQFYLDKKQLHFVVAFFIYSLVTIG